MSTQPLEPFPGETMHHFIGSRDKSVPWYSTDVEDALTPPVRKLFEEYSGIPAEQVASHILKVRDRAWEIIPYPCLGKFHFLEFGVSMSPHYASILQRISPPNTQKFLDLGCCFGYDIRRLVFDGASPENTYGCDLKTKYINLGYEFFLDKGKLGTKFFAPVDIFNEQGGPGGSSSTKELDGKTGALKEQGDPDGSSSTEELDEKIDTLNEQEGGPDGLSSIKELDGKIDIIYTGEFFHLWGLVDQKFLAERIVQLLKPIPGSMVLGRQMGAAEPVEHSLKLNGASKIYCHNIQSWEKMWKEVGETTNSDWKVEAELRDTPDIVSPEGQKKEPIKWLYFCVTRV